MKRLLLPVILACSCLLAAAQDNPEYNKALADSLGANDMGMKNYILVILKTGPNNVQEKEVRDSLFRGHMQNINRLADAGKLIIAGPFQKNDKEYRGIFLLDVKTMEEAKVLVDTDPVINSKLMEAEYFGWFGSAAIPTYLPNHKKVQKKL